MQTVHLAPAVSYYLTCLPCPALSCLSVPCPALPASVSALAPLPAERSLFYRERNDGLYSTFTSLAAKMFEEVVINVVVS